jgi:hypothetical protein
LAVPNSPPGLNIAGTKGNLVVFDGTNGTPDTSQGGIASVMYNSRIKEFLISIPEVGSDLTAGAVAVMDPVTGR